VIGERRLTIKFTLIGLVDISPLDPRYGIKLARP
jgi:hypothetical protein